MAVMKMEDGGGKINLSKKENTIANTLCSVSLYALSLLLSPLSSMFMFHTVVDEVDEMR
jgi:hypothetical protein